MTHILIINGSSRKEGNCQILAGQASAGAALVKDTEIRQFTFAGKAFAGCRAECSAYCMKNGDCSIKDGLQELWEDFIWADGIVWVVPVYHVGVPGQVKCAMDRLCNMQYSYFQGKYPRWNKAWGSIVQGSSRWGGQEYTIQWLIESALLMKCIPLAADAPGSYFGVAGYAPTWEKDSIRGYTAAMELSVNMGRRTAELARIIQAGLGCLGDELEQRYFPAKCMEARSKTELEISDSWQTNHQKGVSE